MKLNIHWPSVAYASTSVGSGMMGSVFFFYYVKVFLNMYKISEAWFQASQVIYMVWNAVNDPLFGYMQDNGKWACVKSRRHSILYGAVFYSIAFLVPWFKWGSYEPGSWLCGIHLIISLCFYDTLLTFVLLAQSALFTEMSSKQSDRVQLIKYCQIASLIGSTSVFFCDYVSDNLTNFGNFQIACVIIAVLSFFFMSYTGRNADTNYIPKATSLPKTQADIIDKKEDSDKPSILKLTWQIVSQRNFLCFVFVNFCTIFETTFVANFVVILVENLIPQEYLPSHVRSFYFGLFFIVPQITVIFLTPFTARMGGSYYVIRSSMWLRIAAGITMFFLGRRYYILMLIYFLLAKGLAKSTFSFFNMTVSDIIDTDMQQFQRKEPISSSIFGTNALITKPAHSFAPMFAVAVFNRYGYEQLKDKTLTDAKDISHLHDMMFSVMCLIPVIAGFLQLTVWSLYTLRNTQDAVAKTNGN
ncbi:unnamed protein product [Owenia fusiformis]|uniref:Transmembrane protein 180 n=1 Tax=Owenia fusiformis TaxID=6347 RepID=A0A8S4PSM6_OWEFU|nr:unnamed protein product [Owenia fusiformis]